MEAGKIKKIIRSNSPAFFFSGKEKKAVIEAIIKAEKETSGEIRVHVA